MVESGTSAGSRDVSLRVGEISSLIAAGTTCSRVSDSLTHPTTRLRFDALMACNTQDSAAQSKAASARVIPRILARCLRAMANSYGSSAGTLNTRTAGVRAMDVALLKNFNFTERRYFQFRAEAFNWLNHPVFSAPNSNFGDSIFGVITGAAVGARQMQLALKFYF